MDPDEQGKDKHDTRKKSRNQELFVTAFLFFLLFCKNFIWTLKTDYSKNSGFTDIHTERMLTLSPYVRFCITEIVALTFLWLQVYNSLTQYRYALLLSKCKKGTDLIQSRRLCDLPCLLWPFSSQSYKSASKNLKAKFLKNIPCINNSVNVLGSLPLYTR